MNYTPRRRRLSDLLLDADFLLCQLASLSTGPHHTAAQQMNLSDLHRQLDGMENRLRVRAAELGEVGHSSMGELRRALTRREESYAGPERRRPVPAQL